MTPTILVSTNKKSITTFIKSYSKDHHIEPIQTTQFSPEKKEFTIAQVRQIKKEVTYATRANKLYVLHDFDTASYEAQNAFLKTLEEPPPRTHFIMIVASAYSLLPTIRSRSKTVKLAQKAVTQQENITKLLDDYLKNPHLSLMADTHLEAIKDKPFELLDECISFFRTRLPDDKKASRILQELLRTRSLVARNNLAPQYALDHIFIFIKKIYDKIS